jgi:hypothetical protein
MARYSLRGVTLALAVGAAIGTAHGTEKDVLGWENARWGMDENEIRSAFSSRVLVPVAAGRSGETALNIPGYVFLECPFDVSFRFTDGGLVRIELTQVEKLTSHYSDDPNEYETGASWWTAGSRTNLGLRSPGVPRSVGILLREISGQVSGRRAMFT